MFISKNAQLKSDKVAYNQVSANGDTGKAMHSDTQLQSHHGHR